MKGPGQAWELTGAIFSHQMQGVWHSLWHASRPNARGSQKPKPPRCGHSVAIDQFEQTFLSQPQTMCSNVRGGSRLKHLAEGFATTRRRCHPRHPDIPVPGIGAFLAVARSSPPLLLYSASEKGSPEVAAQCFLMAAK